jgi:bacteriocin-like protein
MNRKMTESEGLNQADADVGFEELDEAQLQGVSGGIGTTVLVSDTVGG